jgi:hypothetical protein
MKRRFGVDVTYPIQRAIRGLTQPIVPDQGGEHFAGASDYTGGEHADWDGTDVTADPATHGCLNPIFAASLPTDAKGELCHLARGPRTKDMVFYMIIGGVPHQLLQVDPTNPDSPVKTTLTDGAAGSDWWRIVGKDPMSYDFTGADPHMLVSAVPRAGIAPGDPINGGDFDNGVTDLQYACIFPLATPLDCADPKLAQACDCSGTFNGPLCANPGPYGPSNSMQIMGKASPSVRELSIARAMGNQAVVGSVCPIHSTEQAPGDPLYGFRPAFDTLLARIKPALGQN